MKELPSLAVIDSVCSTHDIIRTKDPLCAFPMLSIMLSESYMCCVVPDEMHAVRHGHSMTLSMQPEDAARPTKIAFCIHVRLRGAVGRRMDLGPGVQPQQQENSRCHEAAADHGQGRSHQE